MKIKVQYDKEMKRVVISQGDEFLEITLAQAKTLMKALLVIIRKQEKA